MSILFTNVYKSYGDVAVLSGFSFEFLPSLRYAVMGASGIGKTTLLRLAARLTPPDSGTVLYKKEDMSLSFLFQEDRLLPSVSAQKNVALVGGEEKAQTLLFELGLDGFSSALPSALSGGMCRRVALARTLAKKADAYLFDEPFLGLDEQTKAQAISCILRHTQGALCLFVLHNANDAHALLTETVLL